MNGLVIRVAATEERGELEALELRAGLSNSGDRENLLAHPDAIYVPEAQIAAGRVFVADCDGVIGGFAAVEPRPDGDAELDGLFVDPSMQRRGIGRALVDYCAGYARMQRAAALHVVGNPHAAEFYVACGFEKIGRAETRFGPAARLKLRL